uniref:bifunctional 2',3'-cyclic-nucleotide 2'-phosphodiesterase/3'-nucleotidase n=1 Tax=Paenibacillus zanthoxyli TaxID=369399 RepID=UPI001E3486CD
MMWKKRWNKPLASVLATAVLSAQVLGGFVAGAFWNADKAEAADAGGSSLPLIDLRLISTTDVHTNVYGWDYFKNAPSSSVGLARTATLIHTARSEQPNNLLLDNGDLIQGTPLGTYEAKIEPVTQAVYDSKPHPMMAALNTLHYDAATFGNHEFNYGLEFLDRVVNGSATDSVHTKANFPYINANIYKPDGVTNYFKPYEMITKTVKDTNGQDQTIKVGLLGLVTPQITEWDKANLEGKVITKGIVETAEKFVPEMRAAGADVIVVMAHTGFDAAAAGPNAENAISELSQVPGIDAITFSHTHKVFPTNWDTTKLDASFIDPATKQPYSYIDNVNGHIHGVPAVQAGYGGGYLGLIDLKITKDGSGKWVVDKTASKASTRSAAGAAEDPAILDAVGADHQATIDYTGIPLGTTTAPMNSYFALVQDDPTVQIVTYAQKHYAENEIATNPALAEYRGLPILSVGAPFKAGRNGPGEYTSIDAGPLTIRSASDLYLYDNTLKVIKVKGSVVKEWLEMSAGVFNRIKPGISTPQSLLNPKFAVFNFDVIDGIKYKIDVTKNAKYKTDGTINDASSSRITEVTYNNAPLDPNMDFIVVTNNYRASGGGNFPGVKGSTMIMDTQTENRQVLMDYIKESGTIDPTADNNWSLAPIKGNVNVTFTSSPDAKNVLPGNIKDTGATDAKGFEVYSLNLKETLPAPTQDVEVHLIGINDFHGQLDTTSVVNGKNAGTAAVLATYLKQARAKYENSILFHNGDSVGASAPVSSLERDEPTIEWMNLMGFDVGSLGNHEFDQGVEALKTQLFGGADPKNNKVVHAGTDFDYVNANAVDSKTGTPIINPYVIKEIGGVKIGFIGVVTKATPSKVSPAGTAGVRFLSPEEEVQAIEKYAAELQGKGVQTIVVLAHDPASTKGEATTGEAADLASALPANSPVDVIVAGDNHAFANGVVNGKLVVQAYSYGTAFEDIKLVIDHTTGDVKTKSAAVTTTFQDGVTPDAATVDLVNKYLNLHPELTKPVGTTDGTITRTDAYNNESALGNLIADAMINADFGDGKKADFAFMNPGGIRADLPNGNVSFGDLAKIQPFGNTLVKLTLTGAQIKTLLLQQWGVKADGSPDTKTLQISGLKYTANLYLPVANRIASLTKTDGTPIDPNQTYTAVVNNFMAAGGDNYKVLTEASASVPGPIDLDVFYDYVVKTFKGGPIISKIEGRITNNLSPAVVSEPGTSTPKPTPSPSASPAPSATPAPSTAPAPA